MWLKFSKKPIVLEQRVYEQSTCRSSYSKPKGFWITDDTSDNWEAWCRSEEFCLDGLACRHEVDIDMSRILLISDSLQMDSFVREWMREHDEPGCRDGVVDWLGLSHRHSGLIITPYMWQFRLERMYSWYYGWDCASGCVWDTSAILAVRHAPAPP